MWRWEAIRHALAECQGPNSDKINFNDSQVFGDQAHHKLSADVSGRRCHPRDILVPPPWRLWDTDKVMRLRLQRR